MLRLLLILSFARDGADNRCPTRPPWDENLCNRSDDEFNYGGAIIHRYLPTVEPIRISLVPVMYKPWFHSKIIQIIQRIRWVVLPKKRRLLSQPEPDSFICGISSDVKRVWTDRRSNIPYKFTIYGHPVLSNRRCWLWRILVSCGAKHINVLYRFHCRVFWLK